MLLREMLKIKMLVSTQTKRAEKAAQFVEVLWLVGIYDMLTS